MRIDHWVASLLVPLALWVLLNGIDDLIIDLNDRHDLFVARGNEGLCNIRELCAANATVFDWKMGGGQI